MLDIVILNEKHEYNVKIYEKKSLRDNKSLLLFPINMSRNQTNSLYEYILYNFTMLSL